MASETVYWGQRALAEISSVGTGLANVSGVAGQTSLLVTGNVYSSNSVTTGNLITNNIIMSSNMSSGTGLGNVYFSGNLVVTGNIFSSGGSVGSGSGTSQGILYSLGSNYNLPSAFASGTAGPTMNGYHINLASFSPEAAQAVTQFGASTGLLKFTTAGLYQVTCVIVGDQPVAKVAIGKTASLTSWTALQASGQGATTGYDYVYNYPVGSSPSEVVTLPVTVTDITQYYYLDVFFSTAVAAPTLLYPTRSTTAVGSNFGTYVQVAPFGNYLTSATGVAAALLANCGANSNLSSPYSSNAYRITMTSANGWTVNGTSTSLAVTANGNFQVNQSGIYEVNLCLNTVGQTACQFQVGSLANDTLNPGSTPANYLYTYAPMYTQDPTTAIKLPLNITNISNVYFVECSFPGTLTGNVALTQTSTFVSIKPIGGYINSGTNPWTQQGTSVYYNSGPVGIGGVVPTSLTETLTVNGNTSFVSNVTVTSDASSNLYTNSRRVPAGSLSVANYVTGSVPLTTTTNLIQNYLSNAATITANTSTGSITQALNLPGTTNSDVFFANGGSSVSLANLATSNLFIEAWVNPSTSFGANGIIIQRSLASTTPSGNADLNFLLGAGNILTFTVSNASAIITASNASALSAGTWYHVAASYTRTALNAGTARVFVNGGLGGTTGAFTVGTQPQLSPSANVVIGTNTVGTAPFFGNVADVRVFSGSLIVPTATFASPASAPFTQSAPSYVTNMGLVGTANTVLALQSQYFPGASTSPYGPCLTLPGTVGSYYSQLVGALTAMSTTNGFTVEAWVNYASFAGAPNYMLGCFSPTGAAYSWTLGLTSTGTVTWGYYNGASFIVGTSTTTITTGSWNHLCLESNGTNLFLFVNGTVQTPVAVSGTMTVGSTTPVVIGQQNSQVPCNFAIAKARIVLGTSGANGNVYSSGNFTPNPNFAPVPAGATVAWQLDSQYALPTYPSIQDVTQLPAQATVYGSLPTPVGGVTSNVLGPYTLSPQLDSIRFDGTGYIDYGNAASSVMTTNLWANAWTIEGWVYPTALGGNTPIYSRSSYGTTNSYDLLIYTQGSGLLVYAGNYTSAPSALSLNTWQHIAVTYDGTQSNIYVNGSYKNGGSTAPYSFNPTYGTLVGAWGPGVATAFASTTSFQGNLADVRVSNVARYTGSSYTVPNVADGSGPFKTDANTLLLLKSLAGQVGTTLEVQGRGLNAVSLGATRSVQSYPPAPMSSYLLDTTSNALVTYGQGKYVASASREDYSNFAWYAFDNTFTAWQVNAYNANGTYAGSVATVDTLGNSYTGEWLQLQLPVSVILSSYSLTYFNINFATKWVILGSRDGINWTLMDSRSGTFWTTAAAVSVTFVSATTQAYTYFRFVTQTTSSSPYPSLYTWILNGTEESLCITNDSKVGVGIANPQRSLEVAGDLVVSGTISGGAGMGSFRNRIINGDMRINQRGATSVTTGYLVDRWKMLTSTANVAMSVVSLVSSDTPFQMGFTNSIRTIVTYGSGVTLFPNYIYNYQIIEGYNIGDFNWGTPFGATTTVSFWHRTNIPAGSVACFSIRNGGVGGTYYNYNAPFTVAAAGVWQYVTITIPPPPNAAGSWATGTNGSVEFYISSNYGPVTSVAGWQANGGVGMVTQFPWWQNAGNYIEFTGVQLERGTVATGFEWRPYATELALCQRYYEIGPNSDRWFSISTTAGRLVGRFVVPKRAAPTISPTTMSYLAQQGSATYASASNQTMGTVTFTPYQRTTTDFASDYTNSTSTVFIPSNGIFDIMTATNQSGGLWTANAEL